MHEHQIQAFTYELREGLLARLTASISSCGAWLLDRKTLSASAIELLMEVHLRCIFDLYAGLAAAGIELTRTGQHTLTALCTQSRTTRTRRIGEVVTLRLEIRFLEDISLPTLLAGNLSIV